MKNTSDIFQKNRIHKLKKVISESYEHLTINDIESLETEYEKSETRMVEVIDIRSRSALIMDLYENIEIKPVVFPSNILSLLVRHDVFLVTIGFRNKKWEVIFMSLPYEIGIF